MSEIVLSAEQSRLVAGAQGPIMVRTESGDVLGILELVAPGDQSEVDEMQACRSRPHQRFTIAEVLAKVQSGNH